MDEIFFNGWFVPARSMKLDETGVVQARSIGGFNNWRQTHTD